MFVDFLPYIEKIRAVFISDTFHFIDPNFKLEARNNSEQPRVSGVIFR